MLDAAQALGHVADDKANPARWKGHLDKLLPKPAQLTRGHQKALPYADVPAFVKRLRASGGMAALALESLILTATRTGETLGATWREIDLDAATWTVPASRMKTGDALSAPLNERALAILADALGAAGWSVLRKSQESLPEFRGVRRVVRSVGSFILYGLDHGKRYVTALHNAG